MKNKEQKNFPYINVRNTNSNRSIKRAFKQNCNIESNVIRSVSTVLVTSQTVHHPSIIFYDNAIMCEPLLCAHKNLFVHIIAW